MVIENKNLSEEEMRINPENGREEKEAGIEEELNDFESLTRSLEQEILLIEAVKGEYSYHVKHEALDFVALLKEVGPVESEEAKLVVSKILDKFESIINSYEPEESLNEKAKNNSLEIIQRLKDI